jgi:elongation factor P
MLSTLNDIKQGLVIVYRDEPFLVMKAKFVRMQQRKPVMQTKLKNLINGKVLEYNFKPGDKVQEADISRKKVNYLYKDKNDFYFMDNETFEQFSLSENQIGENAKFLKESSEVTLLFFNNNPVALELPAKMNFKVIEAPEGTRGDSAQGRVCKTVKIETGHEINVPLFIKPGDTIRINTETGEYVERVS